MVTWCCGAGLTDDRRLARTREFRRDRALVHRRAHHRVFGGVVITAGLVLTPLISALAVVIAAREGLRIVARLVGNGS